jgi:hypothetical protein
VLRLLIILGSAVCGGLLWDLYRAPNRADVSAYWQLVVAVVALILALVPFVRRPSDSSDADPSLLDQLADLVGMQWEQAATERGLRHPDPIRVRWRSAGSLTTPTAAAIESTAFPDIPGYMPLTEQRLRVGGRVDELHQVYGGLPSGRLVIAGAPGSGKSAAAIILVINALRHRRALDAPERDRVPVPVLITLAGWDPGQSIRDWTVQQLQLTYDQLIGGRRGARRAGGLLDGGAVTAVLDGFDEMPEQLHRTAVEVLNANSVFRMVVIGRLAELRDAVSSQPLYGAAAVTLQPVGLDITTDYLSSTRSSQPSSHWGELLERLSRDPVGPLAQALDSPLMITLVRDTLREDTDVAEFLSYCDAHPEPDPAGIENYLLDRFVEVVYRPRPAQPPPRHDAATARRTLEWLAARMEQDGLRELAWWHLPAWVGRLSRAVLVGLLVGLVFYGISFNDSALPDDLGSVVALLLGGLGGLLGAWRAATMPGAAPTRWKGIVRRPRLALGYGAAIGCLSGPWLSFYLTIAVSVVSVVAGSAWMAYVYFANRQRRNAHRLRPSALFGLGLGLGLGLGWVGIGLIGRSFGVPGLGLALLVISLFAVGSVLRLWLARTPEPDALGPLTPLSSWRQGRSAELIGWLALTIPCGVVTNLTGNVLAQVSPLAAGLAFGLVAISGAILGLVFPNSWLTVLACAQLAARHGLPPRLMQFLDDARDRGALRSVGPTYQFRHARLQERLVESESVRQRRDRPGLDQRTLVRISNRLREDSGRTLAWWQIPIWASAAPRIAGVGVAGGLITWLGFGVLDPSPGLSTLGLLVGVSAALGAALGVRRLSKEMTTTAVAPIRIPAARRPVLWGLGAGVAFGLDLMTVVPSAVIVIVFAGLFCGALLWLVDVASLSRGRPGVRRRRRSGLGDLPDLVRFLFGVFLGYVCNTGLFFLPVFAQVVLYVLLQVFVTLVVLAAGLRIGLGSIPPGSGGDPPDPFSSWHRGRVAQLTIWLLAGTAVGGFVVRSDMRLLVLGDPGSDQHYHLVVVIALALAFCWGLLLGLLFPASWLTSFACVQLSLRDGLPRRLMPLLEDSRRRGTVRTAGQYFEFPAAAGPGDD